MLMLSISRRKTSQLIDQALEKTCVFACMETDGLGMIHILLEMFRRSRAIEFTRIKKNVLVYVYIAHKIILEFLWQRFLNYISPKYYQKDF